MYMHVIHSFVFVLKMFRNEHKYFFNDSQTCQNNEKSLRNRCERVFTSISPRRALSDLSLHKRRPLVNFNFRKRAIMVL